MDLGLRDRVYLVTGGSRGLGFAAAQALVADGARVLLSAPHDSTAAAAAARITRDAASGAAAWAVVDNADPAAPGELITAARERFGRLDASLAGTGGSIAFVLAASVRAPLPGLAISNGLFPGLAGVVKTLADEHGPSGIRINGLLPVRIATDRVRQLDALLGDPDEVRARVSQTIPLRRYGETAEFGQTAAFLLSPAASYITGAMFPVDGGAIRSF
jgi:3-oxoacyl-[acyl-carrier protein] reductase